MGKVLKWIAIALGSRAGAGRDRPIAPPAGGK
jgi:hypothetical protein